MKKTILLMTITIILIMYIGNPVIAQQQGYNITKEADIMIASTYAPDHSLLKACVDVFKKVVEEESNGKIHVTVSAGGAFGSEDSITELQSSGAIEMQAAGHFPTFMYAPTFTFIDTPFVFKDWEHHKRVVASSIGDEWKREVLEKSNILILGVSFTGYHHVMTANTPVVHPKDVVGLKMRLPVIDAWIAPWVEIGVLAVPIALDEMYASLATGVVESVVGTMEQHYSFKLYEILKHVSNTTSHVGSSIISINNDFYNSLEPDAQRLISDAAEMTVERATNLTFERAEDLKNIFEEQGCAYLVANKEEFQKAAAPAVEKLFKEKFTDFTWEEILNK